MLFSKMCSKCGRRNGADAAFCSQCGNSLSAPRKRGGCLGRTLTSILLLGLGVLALSFLGQPGSLGLDRLLGRRPQPTAATTPAPQGAAPALEVTPLITAAPALAPVVTVAAALSGQHAIRYTVDAASATAATFQVAQDYLVSDGSPAHSVSAPPWEQNAQLAPGQVARLVATGPAGQAFVARIYVDGVLAAEAQAVPVTGGVWRAQCEVPLGAP